MKAIVYIVAIVAICGAAFFSFNHSNKFKALEAVRVETLGKNTEATTKADAAEVEIEKLNKELTTATEQESLLTQAVSSLKSKGTSLQSGLRKLDDEMKVQDGEFKELEKALEQVNAILVNLGGGVTLETLPEKIQEIEADRTAKQKKLGELEELVSGAEKSLASSRAELDRLAKRTVERNSRIARNSTEAVVTAVSQDWGFLVIGAGSNSGFTPQTDLLVERDGRMIGRIRPSSVEPTQTIAEINRETLVSGVRLQPGDRVILSKPTAN